MADFGEDFFTELVTALASSRPVKVRTGFLSSLMSLGGRACRSVIGLAKFGSPLRTKKGFAVAVGAAAVTYGAYRVVRWSGMVEPVRQVYNITRVALGGEPKVVAAAQRIATMKSTFESVRAGSTESKMPMPKNQSLVGELVNGEFHAVGCAIRMGNWLVMPSHVYAAVEKPCVKGRQSSVDISQKEYVDLDTDLIGLKLGNQTLSVIGLADIGCYNDIPKQGAFSSICGSGSLGTTGVVRLDSSVFGRVTYDGTTVAGYSGSPYMAGTSLIGIHTSGGVVNGGYAAGYVKTVLQTIDKDRLESSEDWLQNIYRDGQEIWIDPKWNDIDEVRIQVGGRFAIVSRRALSQAFGNEWQTQTRQGKFSRRMASSYGDLESGESSMSKSGASTLLEESPDLAETKLQAAMRAYAKLSPKQKAKALASWGAKRDLSTPLPRETLIGNSSV